MSEQQQKDGLVFPDNKATPNEVRSFIEKVLISEHDVSPSDASRIAQLWGIGRGRELAQISQRSERHRFEKIFGDDNGLALCNSMRELKEEKKRRESQRLLQQWKSNPHAKAFSYCWRIGLVMAVIMVCLGIKSSSNTACRNALIAACFCIGGPQLLQLDAPESRAVGGIILSAYSFVIGIVVYMNISD